MTAHQWRNRVVGHEDVAPDQLLANPFSFRIHTHLQQQALEGVLDEVGWVRGVLVNVQTQHVVDGHLRVKTALERGEPTVPVDYIDVSPEEELVILASLDPLAAMAGTDSPKLGELMQEIHRSASEALKEALGKIKEVSFVARVHEPDTSSAYGVLIQCDSPVDQAVLLARFQSEGLSCKAVGPQ